MTCFVGLIQWCFFFKSFHDHLIAILYGIYSFYRGSVLNIIALTRKNHIDTINCSIVENGPIYSDDSLVFVYCRYFSEPPEQVFVDVCTLAKVSVFMLDEKFHGFYLHCR